jgi:hypothetical protein
VQNLENFNKNQVSALDKCVLQKEFSNVIKLFLCRWKIWSSASGLSSAEEDIIGINVLKLFWKLDCEMSIMTDQFCRNRIFLSFDLSSVILSHFLISGIHEELQHYVFLEYWNSQKSVCSICLLDLTFSLFIILQVCEMNINQKGASW